MRSSETGQRSRMYSHVQIVKTRTNAITSYMSAQTDLPNDGSVDVLLAGSVDISSSNCAQSASNSIASQSAPTIGICCALIASPSGSMHCTSSMVCATKEMQRDEQVLVYNSARPCIIGISAASIANMVSITSETTAVCVYL
jgi:hypothetical protein